MPWLTHLVETEEGDSAGHVAGVCGKELLVPLHHILELVCPEEDMCERDGFQDAVAWRVKVDYHDIILQCLCDIEDEK